jgi:hypothetical protein
MTDTKINPHEFDPGLPIVGDWESRDPARVERAARTTAAQFRARRDGAGVDFADMFIALADAIENLRTSVEADFDQMRKLTTMVEGAFERAAQEAENPNIAGGGGEFIASRIRKLKISEL